MRTPRLLAVLLAGLALFVVAACGGGGGGDESGEGTGAEAVPAGTWIGDVCTALGTWKTDLTEGVPDLSGASDAASAKEAIGTYLDSVVTATQTLVTDLQAAGVPDVENGEAIATEIRGAIEDVGDEFSDAKADVAALSTDDPAAFASDLDEIGTTLSDAATSAGTAFDEIADKYPNSGLDAAAAEAPACTDVLG